MKSFTFLVLVSAGLLALEPPAHADRGEAQRGRFAAPLKRLRSCFPTGDTRLEDVAEHAWTSGARTAAFNLQALTRVYENLHPSFKELGKEAEGLEDAIGEMDKWKNILLRDGDEAIKGAERKRIEGHLEQAKKAYRAHINDAKWVRPEGGQTVLDRAEALIAEYDWPSAKADRDFVIQQLDAEVKEVRDHDYNMSRLERGRGLHKLRRQLRWFMIEAQAMGGLVSFRDSEEACPIQEFSGNLERQIVAIDPTAIKYVDLPARSRGQDPCLISKCLFQAMGLLVTKLGSIKDHVEAINSRNPDESDEVPSRFRAQAERVYSTLRETKLLEEIHSQLKECR